MKRDPRATGTGRKSAWRPRVKILFDQGVPNLCKRIWRATRCAVNIFQLGWRDKKTGGIARLAEQAGF